MLYIALILVTILSIFFAVAHEEQKHKTTKYQQLALRLKKENDALKYGTMDSEFEQLALKCFSE